VIWVLATRGREGKTNNNLLGRAILPGGKKKQIKCGRAHRRKNPLVYYFARGDLGASLGGENRGTRKRQNDPIGRVHLSSSLGGNATIFGLRFVKKEDFKKKEPREVRRRRFRESGGESTNEKIHLLRGGKRRGVRSQEVLSANGCHLANSLKEMSLIIFENPGIGRKEKMGGEYFVKVGISSSTRGCYKGRKKQRMAK